MHVVKSQLASRRQGVYNKIGRNKASARQYNVTCWGPEIIRKNKILVLAQSINSLYLRYEHWSWPMQLPPIDSRKMRSHACMTIRNGLDPITSNSCNWWSKSNENFEQQIKVPFFLPYSRSRLLVQSEPLVEWHVHSFSVTERRATSSAQLREWFYCSLSSKSNLNTKGGDASSPYRKSGRGGKWRACDFCECMIFSRRV